MRKDATTKRTFEQINAMYGKEPPSSLELEEAVLSEIIKTGVNGYNRAEPYLNDDTFYHPKNRIIFGAIKRLAERKSPIDLPNITYELKSHNELDSIGGIAPLMEVTNKMSVNLTHNCRIISQLRIRRELISSSQYLLDNAYDEQKDIDDSLTEHVSNVSKLGNVPYENIKTTDSITDDLYELIKINYNNDSLITGTPTGILPLDTFMGGLHPTDLTIIAAEPGMGKTSFALTCVRNILSIGQKASVFSLEMPPVQLLARLVSPDIHIPYKSITRHKLEGYQVKLFEDQIQRLKKLPLFIDEDSYSSLSKILHSIRFLHDKMGVKQFIIDYIQLIYVDNLKDNREGQLAHIARELKNIAKELNIHIMLLSQLNRDKNKSERPTKDRLRGSGQIADAADNIIFIYRPEVYGLATLFDESTSRGRAELIIEKGRNIGNTTICCYFDAPTGEFHIKPPEDYDIPYDPDMTHSPDSPPF